MMLLEMKKRRGGKQKGDMSKQLGIDVCVGVCAYTNT